MSDGKCLCEMPEDGTMREAELSQELRILDRQDDDHLKSMEPKSIYIRRSNSWLKMLGNSSTNKRLQFLEVDFRVIWLIEWT